MKSLASGRPVDPNVRWLSPETQETFLHPHKLRQNSIPSKSTEAASKTSGQSNQMELTRQGSELLGDVAGASIISSNPTQAMSIYPHGTAVSADPVLPVLADETKTETPTFNNGAEVADISLHQAYLNETKSLLQTQRSDIERIESKVTSLAEDMKMHQQDMMNVKQDVKRIRDAVDYMKFQTKTLSEHNATAPGLDLDRLADFADDLKILTEDISRTSDKANEVDGLKLELRMLKQRVQRMEDSDQHAPQKTGLVSQLRGSRRTDNYYSNSQETLPQQPSQRQVGAASSFQEPDETAPLMAALENGLPWQPDNAVGLSEVGAGFDPSFKSPRITSADKVAARKRRYRSGTSTSPPFTDDSPEPKRPATSKAKASLNSRDMVYTSDSEDADYGPGDGFRPINPNDKPTRHRRKAPVRIPTPEWERESWDGTVVPPGTGNNHRTSNIPRRGVSGRKLVSSGRESMRRTSSGLANDTTNAYAYATSPSYWGKESPAPKASSEKPRNREGFLLRPNGQVDGRSIRQHKKRMQKRINETERQKRGLGDEKREAEDRKRKAHEGREERASRRGSGVSGASNEANGNGFVDMAALTAAGAHTSQPAVMAAATVGATAEVPPTEFKQEGSNTAEQLVAKKHEQTMERIFPPKWR